MRGIDAAVVPLERADPVAVAVLAVADAAVLRAEDLIHGKDDRGIAVRLLRLAVLARHAERPVGHPVVIVVRRMIVGRAVRVLRRRRASGYVLADVGAAERALRERGLAERDRRIRRVDASGGRRDVDHAATDRALLLELPLRVLPSPLRASLVLRVPVVERVEDLGALVRSGRLAELPGSGI